MSQNYADVARRFLFGDKPLRSLFGRSGGRYRMSYGDDRRVLLSYEHYPLAVRLTSGDVLVNVSKPPSATTATQLRAVLAACRNRVYAAPFSLLDDLTRAALLGWAEPEPNETAWARSVDHGDLLLRVGSKTYLTGVDRNDDAKKRARYVRALVGAPATLAAAHDSLVPKEADVEGTFHHGAYFFTRAWERVTRHLSGNGGYVFGVAREARPTRHDSVAGHVYVRGTVRSDFGALKLGDGKTWYRVVQEASASYACA